MKGSLATLFAPRSVAVVGASRDPSKVGGSVLANRRAAGFEGRVVPINARAGGGAWGLGYMTLLVEAGRLLIEAVALAPAAEVGTLPAAPIRRAA